MAAVSGKMLPVGARHARIFQLNASGSPAATDTSAYEGNQIVGARAFDMTIPDARRISHAGDDRVLQVDFLPPLEGIAAELRAARNDYDVYAILTGTSVVTEGEAKIIGIATSEQGSEPQVALLLYQQALDDEGTRHYRSYLIPKAVIYPHPNSFNDAPSENRFMVAPQVVDQHLWETNFATGTEGYTEAQALEIMTRYKPKIVAFLGDTSTTSFSLPTAEPAADTAKMVIWVDGTEQTSGVTKGTTQIQFTTAPDTNARIVSFYEVA